MYCLGGTFYFPKRATGISPLPATLLQCELLLPLPRGGDYFSIPLNLDGPREYFMTNRIGQKWCHVLGVALNWPHSFLFLSLGMLTVGTLPIKTNCYHTVRSPNHMAKPHAGVLGDNTRWYPQLRSAYMQLYEQVSEVSTSAEPSGECSPSQHVTWTTWQLQARTTHLNPINQRIMRNNHNSF